MDRAGIITSEQPNLPAAPSTWGLEFINGILHLALLETETLPAPAPAQALPHPSAWIQHKPIWRN